MSECLSCGKETKSKPGRWKIYCSRRCRQSYYNRKYKESNQNQSNLNPSFNSTHIGTISEMVVCCDLLKKGYDVFRNISGGGEVDLLVKKRGDKNCYSIEVTTGHFDYKKRMFYPKRDIEKFDVLAICINNEIYYKTNRKDIDWAESFGQLR